MQFGLMSQDNVEVVMMTTQWTVTY